MAYSKMGIIGDIILEAKQDDHNMISNEIIKEIDEIKSVIDSEFVDFKDSKIK